jgi:hypothetical protein
MVPSNVVYQVMSLLDSCHARLVSVTQSRESLEDAFLRLVG